MISKPVCQYKTNCIRDKSNLSVFKINIQNIMCPFSLFSFLYYTSEHIQMQTLNRGRGRNLNISAYSSIGWQKKLDFSEWMLQESSWMPQE